MAARVIHTLVVAMLLLSCASATGRPPATGESSRHTAVDIEEAPNQATQEGRPPDEATADDAAARPELPTQPAASCDPMLQSCPAARGEEDKIAAAHIVVQWAGAKRASPSVSRTKQQARARIQEALQRARRGEPFADLVAEYSDEPGAAARAGKLGRFPRRAMVEPFANAAFALEPGELSGVVETEFGYHIILRTE